MDIFKHIFFLLALRFRSKLKQDVNISPFVNHFVLKNPLVLDTFLHANLIKHVYLKQNSKFSKFLFAPIFLLNDVIGAMLSKNVGWFLQIAFLYVLQSVIWQINDFWFTKTGIVWLAVNLCKILYPRYNLAGKSTSKFYIKCFLRRPLR